MATFIMMLNYNRTVIAIINYDCKTVIVRASSLTEGQRYEQVPGHIFSGQAWNTKGGSITVPLTSSLTGLD